MKTTATAPKDLTHAQFVAAIRKHGMVWSGTSPMSRIGGGTYGYVCVLPRDDGQGSGLNVYAENGGRTRRAMLAYLIRQRDQHLEYEALRAEAVAAANGCTDPADFPAQLWKWLFSASSREEPKTADQASALHDKLLEWRAGCPANIERGWRYTLMAWRCKQIGGAA